jgi:hypothetical protein
MKKAILIGVLWLQFGNLSGKLIPNSTTYFTISTNMVIPQSTNNGLFYPLGYI